ncbi:CpsB/CapC family capsule biosynthesis tyrosine phosphatase [Cohnella sp. WQ 127256]|uniref:tyrosine-protein phosphatase n=1 Tax=Cohnella sp. WQ 127256 TaxID=2938790 RepID=UPI0021190BF2
MIDTHCHILPMCDDGPDHWDQSLEMAREAIRHGITEIIATPHHGKGNYINRSDKIRSLVNQMNNELGVANIPLKVWVGQEYHLGIHHRSDFEASDLQTLGDSKYVLVELPSRQTPKSLNSFINVLIANLYIPIIVHPERHVPFIRKPEKLYELIKLGVLFQLTAPSLIGHFGQSVQQAAWLMARNGWIHILASDAHDLNKRGFRLGEAYLLLESELGHDRVEILRANAQQLAHGGAIDRGTPVIPHRTKRWWSPLLWKQKRNF